MAFTVEGVIQLAADQYNQALKKAQSDGVKAAGNIQSAFGKISGAMGALSKAIPVVAIGAACKGIYNMAKATASAGDAIDKNSQKLGLSRRAYQEWTYVLSQNGASIQSMGTAFRTMSNGIVNDTKTVGSALESMGLSIDTLTGQTAEQQFFSVVTALQGMESSSERLAAATKIFGRSAQDLMPLLNSESGSVQELMQRAHDLGIVLDDETIDSSVGFTDALDDMSRAWTGLKQKFGSQFLKPFTKAFTYVADTVGRLSVAMGDSIKSGDWGIFFDSLTDTMSDGMPKLVDGLTSITIGLISSSGKIVQLAASIVKGLAKGAVRAAKALITSLPDIMSAAGSAIKDAITAVFGTVFSGATGVVQTIVDTFGNVFDDIKDIFDGKTDVISGIRKVFYDLFGFDADGNSTGTGIMGIAASILGSFSGLIDDILTALGVPADVKEQVLTWVNTAFADFLDVGQSILGIFTGNASNGNKSLISQIISALTIDGDMATKMNFAIKSLFGSSKDGELSGLLGIAGKIRNSFSGLVTGIIGTLTGDVTKAGQIGSLINTIFDAPLNIVQTIIDTFTGKGEGDGRKLGLIERIQNIFDPANNGTFTGNISKFLNTLFGVGEGYDGVGVNGVIGQIQGMFQGALNSICAVFNIDESSDLITGISGGLSTLFGGAQDVISTVIQTFTGKNEDGSDGLIGKIAAAFDNPGDWGSNISGVLATLFGVDDDSTTGVRGLISKVQGIFQGLLGNIATALSIDETSAAWQGVTGYFDTIFSYASNIVQDIVAVFSGKDNSDGTHTDGILKQISDVFSGNTTFTEGLRGIFETLFGLGKNSDIGINGVISDMKSAFEGVMDNILLAFGVDTNSEEYKSFRKGIDDVFGFVQNVVSSIAKVITGTFDEDGNKVTDGLIDSFEKLFNPDVPWTEKVESFVTAILGSGKEGEESGILGIGTSLKSLFSGLLDNIMTWIFGENPEQNQTAADIKSLLWKPFDGILGIGQVISDTLRGTDGKPGLLTQIFNVLSEDGSLFDKIGGIWTALLGDNTGDTKTGIYGLADKVVGVIKTIPGAIARLFLGEDNEWAKLIGEWSQTIGDGFMDMLGGFGTFITSVVDFVGQITSGDYSGAIATLNDGLFGENGLVAGFQSLVGGLASGTIAGIGKLLGFDITPEQVKAKWDTLCAAIRTPLQTVADTISKIILGIEYLLGIKKRDSSGLDQIVENQAMREALGINVRDATMAGKYADYSEAQKEAIKDYLQAYTGGFNTDAQVSALNDLLGQTIAAGIIAEISQYQTAEGKGIKGNKEWFNSESYDGWFEAGAEDAVNSVRQKLSEADFQAALELIPQLAYVGGDISSVSVSTGSTGIGTGRIRGHHATGLDYVPFDDYAARLHRGEAVLSAFEAAAWRDRGQLYGGSMGNTYNDSSTLYVGQMYMSSDLDAAQLQQTLAAMTRRRNRGYGA